MKTTRYFDEQVLRKRPYLRVEWIERVLADPSRRIIQADHRLRLWRRIVTDGAVVDIDIDRASEQLDLTTLETTALPVRTRRAA